MRRVMVRYTVKAEAAAENERLIGEVFAELAREQPEGLRYRVFVLEDGVTFVHVSEQSGALAPPDFPAFKAFQADHASRAVAPPTVSALREVGAYG